MLTLIKKSIQDFHLAYKKYVTFALLYLLFTGILFIPLISYLFNRLLRAVGSGSLLNAEVYRLGLDAVGLIGMFLIGILTVLFLFIEFGVFIIISRQIYFRRHVLISEAFFTAFRKLPALAGVGLIPLMFMFFVIIPFIDSPAVPTLLDFNLPIFLTNQMAQISTLVMLIVLCLLVLGIFMFIRLIFTLHYLFIEKITVWTALKNSWNLTKTNHFRTLASLFVLNLLFFLSGFFLLTALSWIPNVSTIVIINQMIDTYLLAFSGFITFMLSLLFLPVNIIIITRLFYRFKKDDGERIKDELVIHTPRRLAAIERRSALFFRKRKYLLLTALVIYLTTIFAVNYTVSDQLVYLKWNVQVAAHRGDLHSAPENSLSSIEAALEKGVDAVEIDVMITADDVIILNHDDTFVRVAGVPGRVEEMMYADVAEIDIGRYFSDEFIGESVPTLDEALERMRLENTTLIIDVKLSDLSHGEVMIREIVEAVEQFEMTEDVYIQAFQYELLEHVRALNEEIKIGQILYLSAGNLSNLDVDFYTVRQTMLTERFIDNARRQNREVWVWTVNVPRAIREVLEYDIDGIITDYPERVQGLIGIEEREVE